MKIELLDYLLADSSYSLDEAINIIDFYTRKMVNIGKTVNGKEEDLTYTECEKGYKN